MQSLLHLHQPLAQSLPHCRSRRACVCEYVHVVGWVETAQDRCFVRQCRQVYTRGQVLLTLRLFVLSNLSITCVCITGVFKHPGLHALVERGDDDDCFYYFQK